MTMSELAKLAHVSVSTVSKAFSEADDVSEETKKHIFEIAKENGCYGAFYKGKYPKKLIAIICSELISNYYIGFVERLQGMIEKNGGIALISTDHFSKSRQQELIDYYASYLKVDGIIVFSLQTPVKKGYDVPIVSLFSSIDTAVDSINTNFEPAMNESIELLYSYGHRNIAFIGENHTVGKSELFKKTTKKYRDINTLIIQTEDRFEKAGEKGIKQLLKTDNDCTAIICAYDNIAFGAIKQLKREGFSVPKDYSVIGMDNICISGFTETTLTSIDSNPDETCMIAWDLLQKKQKNKFYRSNQDISIRSRLVIRESVGEAPIR